MLLRCAMLCCAWSLEMAGDARKPQGNLWRDDALYICNTCLAIYDSHGDYVIYVLYGLVSCLSAHHTACRVFRI
jgi:hypothetical protein